MFLNLFSLEYKSGHCSVPIKHLKNIYTRERLILWACPRITSDLTEVMEKN